MLLEHSVETRAHARRIRHGGGQIDQPLPRSLHAVELQPARLA
jgi:hypothetical protein